MKKLLIISHTPHYRSDDKVVGWAATVREIDYLSTLFEQVLHVAPLHPGTPPSSTSPYSSNRVHLIPVAPAGGETFTKKAAVLFRFREYFSAIRMNLKKCDAVHVRCPANISLLALIMLCWIDQPGYRWFKYAGNWKPQGSEPLSYRIQRFVLSKKSHQGLVTVNGEWNDQPSHVISFLNPCLSEQDLQRGREIAAQKQLVQPFRLLFCGRLEEAKGATRAIDVAALLKRRGIDVQLDLVGDGPERKKIEEHGRVLGMNSGLFFHGWLPRESLSELYGNAHFFILPSSSSEGWPKVISEAMAFGAVPLAGAISSIPQYLRRFQTGAAIEPMDVDGYVAKILSYVDQTEMWKLESDNAMNSASLFSYSEYLKRVRTLFDMPQQAESMESKALEVPTL